MTSAGTTGTSPDAGIQAAAVRPRRSPASPVRLLSVLLALATVLVLGSVILWDQTGALRPGTERSYWVVYALGAFAVVAIWAFISLLRGTPTFAGIFNGEDGRASTSKFQFFVWTAVVLYAYVGLYTARALHGDFDALADVPRNLLIAMGVSVGTAVGAKAITQSRVADNPGSKRPAAPGEATAGTTGLGWLVTTDEGMPDLTKIQLIAWTLVAVVVFLFAAWNQMGRVLGYPGSAASPPAQQGQASASGSGQTVSFQAACAGASYSQGIDLGCGMLPNIDDSLMILMFLGSGTYLGTKLVAKTSPRLDAVDPSVGDETTVITLTGQSLGGQQDGSRVLIDGMPAEVALLAKDGQAPWTNAHVTFTLPPEYPVATPWSQLGVRTIHLSLEVGGQATNTRAFTYAPALVLNPDPDHPLPEGKVGCLYDSQVVVRAQGGRPPYRWAAGGLPDDLGMAPDAGRIVGTPASSGSFPVTVTVTDSLGLHQSRSFTLHVNPA